MNEAIVTGASGFIGIRVVLQLLQRSWQVHAVGRSKSDTFWQGRMIAALDDIRGEAIDRSLLSRLRCHEMVLTSPDLGLGRLFEHQLSGCRATLFHLAGDTRFNPHDPEQQRAINVGGSLNVMRTFAPHITLVVHVSTAYVAGARHGVIMEDELDVGQTFHNPYERSKLDGEVAVREFCTAKGISLIVVRPSIITNDTQTGRSSTLTHLNAVVEVVLRLQGYYGLGHGEVVSREIRVAVDPLARPNLAPVDPIVEALLTISENPDSSGRTYHLCHPAPQSNAEMLDVLLQALDLRGKVALRPVARLSAPVTHTEKMILRSFKPYLPYLNARSTFDLTNTRSVVPDYDSMFPPLGVDYMRKVVRFEEQKAQVPREGEEGHGRSI
jgi:nucleoside-diphosphate-sugar epimerase